MKRNKKKRFIAAVCIILAVSAVFGAVFFAVSAGAEVNVAPVSSLTQGYWNGNSQISQYGNINASMNQTISYDDSLTIKEIYVSEGDKVKAGDPLISYDTTLAQLEYEMKKMQIEGTELKIQNLQSEIERLKKNGTVAVSAVTSGSGVNIKPVKSRFSNSFSISSMSYESESPSSDNTENSPLLQGSVYSEITEKSEAYTGNGTKENPYRYYVFPLPGKTSVTLGREWIKKALSEKTVSVFDTVDSAENPEKIVFSWEMDFETLLEMAGKQETGYEFPEELRGKKIFDAVTELQSAYNFDTAGGTPENPYKFLCSPGVSVDSRFMSDMLKQGCVAVFYVADSRENPSRILYSWTLDGQGGNTEAPAEPDPIPEPEEPQEPEIPSVEIPSGKDIEKQIKEKEESIRNLRLEKRNSELELKKLEKKLDIGVVKSEIDGTVKTVNDADKAKLEGSPIIYVLGDEGIYVTAAVAETSVDKVEKGLELTVTSWESGEVYTAKVTSVGSTPVENGYFGGNPNMSYYPLIAVISGETNLKNGEGVSISAAGFDSDSAENEIFLMQAFVREDEEGFYVYKKDENLLLKKQYVKIGKITDGAMEIKSGISMEDEIAFPYGKDVKEGAKTKSVETLYLYL